MDGSQFETRVVRDAADLARQAAQRLEDLSRNASSIPLAIALAGGSTPKRLYETLAQPPFRDGVRWDRVELFFGDERAVPPDHPDSNYGMAEKALLSHVPVTAHRMRAELGEAEGYEQLVRARISETRDGIPVFDVILLGMGKDGHTASLFPGTKALDERTRLVVMNEVPQMQTRRMTFTYPLLNAARQVWVLIPGADKREIIGQCLSGRTQQGAEKRWPVVGVRPTHGELIWWLDDASAPARSPQA
jgi:6-phosphogluconolactonase